MNRPAASSAQVPFDTDRTREILLALMRTTFEHGGKAVTVTKDERRWYVEVAGGLASSRFLDDALETAFPKLTERERVALQLKLLQWVYAGAGETTELGAARAIDGAVQEAPSGWPMPSVMSGWPVPSSVNAWPMPGAAA